MWKYALQYINKEKKITFNNRVFVDISFDAMNQCLPLHE